MSTIAFAEALPLPLAAWGGLVLVTLGFAIAFLGVRFGRPGIRAAGLLQVLTGYFVAFAATLPWLQSRRSPWESFASVAAAAALFRLMASLEKPSEAGEAPKTTR